MSRKFWNWVRNEETGERCLMLNGPISEETWFGDEVTPGIFRNELMACEGNITVWINSPGGDCFAAAQIYNMLMEYKGSVTVRIDGLAASAASVIAMAGNTVEMSPVGMFMIHNPMTVSIGDEHEMQKAIDMLSEVKESIINAYELKTGLSHARLANLMDAESWFNAKKAKELGFVDKIMFADKEDDEEDEDDEDKLEAVMFSRAAVTNSITDRLRKQYGTAIHEAGNSVMDNRVDAAQLHKRLDLIKV